MKSESQRKIFRDSILAPVAEEYGKQSEPLCGFMALEGRKYNNKLMVVGRAVNSWGDGQSMAGLQDAVSKDKFIDGLSLQEVDGPMAWVAADAGRTDGYNTNTSAFWRVIRKVSKRLGVWEDAQEADWSSRLVWSNLYKLSPHAGGNPSNKLCAIQEPGCIELLAQEIREYAPERVLFLTGMGWAWPFMTGLECQLRAVKGLVEASGTVSLPDCDAPTPFIVAAHPQGKGEIDWVENVVAGFEAAGVRKPG